MVSFWWHLSIYCGLEQVLSRWRFCKSPCTTWLLVLCSLPLPAAPSVTKLLHLLTQLSDTILSVWPNHLSCICHMTSEMCCIHSLSLLTSVDLCSDRLMLHIHIVISISVCWSPQVSSILTGYVSLPYNNITNTNLIEILPSILCENTFDVKSGRSSLISSNLFWFGFLSLVLPQHQH